MCRVRIILVLTMGQGARHESSIESVYLRVEKPEWDSYALIGPRHVAGDTDEDTGRVTLSEDALIAVSLLDLTWSGVGDDSTVDLTITRGVYSDYSYNLFAAEGVRGALWLCPE